MVKAFQLLLTVSLTSHCIFDRLGAGQGAAAHLFRCLVINSEFHHDQIRILQAWYGVPRLKASGWLYAGAQTISPFGRSEKAHLGHDTVQARLEAFTAPRAHAFVNHFILPAVQQGSGADPQLQLKPPC